MAPADLIPDTEPDRELGDPALRSRYVIGYGIGLVTPDGTTGIT